MLKRIIGEEIEIILKFEENLWLTKLDPVQVDQILLNLATNARDAIIGERKFINETGNVIIDEDYCSKNPEAVSGKFVMLSVSDSGCGMDKDVQERIFEPFYTTKDKIGTGLGLSLVYGIVKQNKGFIEVMSKPGRGTTFKIYFPKFVDEISKENIEEIEETMMGKGERILVVEDEPLVLNYCKRCLKYLVQKKI